MRSERRVAVVESAQRVADPCGHRLAEPLALVVDAAVAAAKPGGAPELVEQRPAFLFEARGSFGVAAQRGVVELGVEVVESTSVLRLGPGIEDRADSLTAATPLFGSMPELDSMAVVELVVALEQRFGLSVDDDEITGDVFETLGSLSAFVDAKRV